MPYPAGRRPGRLPRRTSPTMPSPASLWLGPIKEKGRTSYARHQGHRHVVPRPAAHLPGCGADVHLHRNRFSDTTTRDEEIKTKLKQAARDAIELTMEERLRACLHGQHHWAQLAWQMGDCGLVRRSLEVSIPVTDKDALEFAKRNLRGFEWHYLWRLANSEKRLLRGQDFPVRMPGRVPRMGACSPQSGPPKPRATASVLWDLTTGKKRSSRASPGRFSTVVFTADGKYVVAGGDDKVLHLWDAAAGAGNANAPAGRRDSRRWPGHRRGSGPGLS